jgi:hypothetical protein
MKINYFFILFHLEDDHGLALAEAFRGYGGFGALGHSVYHRELLPRLVHGDWNGKISHLSTSGAHTAAVSDTGFLLLILS